MRRAGQTSRFRLYKNPKRAKIAGVCAGLADYLDFDATLIRLGAVAGACFFPGPIILGYILLAWLLEDRPDGLYESEQEEAFWARVHVEPSGTTRDLRHKFRTIEKRLRDMEAYVTSAPYDLQRKFRDLEEE